ncbi:hypothetical protein AB0O34_22475, partial [Sphaerisporangium sp. NPDC088356]|uniref:hypothetical protein n=1 Tax=Sphaerisporangium sp. NPDC088356 TaxID=3154871 RepID=UPI00343392FE
MTFTTKNFADYYLIWGLNKGGAIAVDDIVLNGSTVRGRRPGDMAVTAGRHHRRPAVRARRPGPPSGPAVRARRPGPPS